MYLTLEFYECENSSDIDHFGAIAVIIGSDPLTGAVTDEKWEVRDPRYPFCTFAIRFASGLLMKKPVQVTLLLSQSGYILILISLCYFIYDWYSDKYEIVNLMLI